MLAAKHCSYQINLSASCYRFRCFKYKTSITNKTNTSLKRNDGEIINAEAMQFSRVSSGHISPFTINHKLLANRDYRRSKAGYLLFLCQKYFYNTSKYISVHKRSVRSTKKLITYPHAVPTVLNIILMHSRGYGQLCFHNIFENSVYIIKSKRYKSGTQIR